MLPAYGAFGEPRDRTGPPGHSYACLLVRLDTVTAAQVRTVLRAVRFTGWLAPPERGWSVVIAERGAGTVAARRLGIVGVGEALAVGREATVLALRVYRDRQLLIAAWHRGDPVGTYVSDPSQDHPDQRDILDEPVGVELAPALAAACGRPEVSEELTDVLGEPLDPDSVIESERLLRVLRLLDLPAWLVAVPSLPHDIPTGPSRRELTRLGGGGEGVRGALGRIATEPVRKRRRQPPAVPDAPRQEVDIDPWLM